MTNDLHEIQAGPIRRHPSVCHGALTFAGHRVYVDQLFGWLQSEQALAEFRTDFPGVSLDQARATLDLASRLLEVVTAQVAVERWEGPANDDPSLERARDARGEELAPKAGRAADEALLPLLAALGVPGWLDLSHLSVDLSRWSDALQRSIYLPPHTLVVLANLAHAVDSTVPTEEMGDELAGWAYRAERLVAEIVGADNWDAACRHLLIPERSRGSLAAYLQRLPADELPARLGRLREIAADPNAMRKTREEAAEAEAVHRDPLEEEVEVVELKDEGPSAPSTMRDWLTEAGVANLNDLPHHECRERQQVHGAAEETRSPSPRGWGGAIDYVVWLDGLWWAVSGGMRPEYSTPVRHCPWCGQRLRAPSDSETGG